MENKKDDRKNINIVTGVGAKTGDDAAKQNQDIHQWVRNNVEPEQNFDVCKEKETFK